MLVRLLKMALVVGFGYGLYLLYDVYFIQAMSRTDLGGSVINQEIQVEQVLLQSFNEKGYVKLRLFGSKARVDEKRGLTYLDPVNLLIYNDEVEFMQETAILASQGIHYNTNPSYFELIGNVECNLAVSADPGKKFSEIRYLRKIFTNKLLYYPDLDKFVSPGPFKIVDTSNNSIITGGSFVYHAKVQTGEIQGGMQSVYNEHPDIVYEELKRGFGEVKD